jgi:hypothetical protein
MNGERRILFADHIANILTLQFLSAVFAAQFSVDMFFIRTATLELQSEVLAS